MYAKYSFEPKDIYNLDETGVMTVMDSPKVLAAKSQRSVAQAASAERGCLVTMVGIVNASGNHLPPAYVFPLMRLNERWLLSWITYFKHEIWMDDFRTLRRIAKIYQTLHQLFKGTANFVSSRKSCITLQSSNHRLLP